MPARSNSSTNKITNDFNNENEKKKKETLGNIYGILTEGQIKMRAYIGYIIYKASTQQRTKQYNTTDLN